MKLLFSVAALLAMTAGSSIAQQKSEVTRESGTLQPDNTVNLAALETVQKDLGVSDEVASKLKLLHTEYRAAVQKEYQDAGLNPLLNNPMTAEQRQRHVEIGRRLNDQFFPKAEELLSADQQRRLQQIQFQSRLRSRGPGALVMPNFASELQLTDNQKQQLNILSREFLQGVLQTQRGNAAEKRQNLTKHREEHMTKAMEVLTAEQKETLNKLKGNEFDLSPIVLNTRYKGK